MATGTGTYTLSHLRPLEVESSHILREVAAEFERPGLLYSVGKDSSDLLRAGSEGRSAVHPGQLPFPLMHVDTGFKFGEMCEFRGRTARGVGGELIVWRNEGAIADRVSPFDRGTRRCCGFLKTEALLTGLRHHGFDAAIGGARRDKEKSRAKERVCSFRDAFGQWDPRRQRPELWNLYNARSNAGESLRVFPLSSWTEQEERGLLLTTRAGPLLSASPKIVASDGGKELAAIGSVDDGKSTRIGRLLDDTKLIYGDQLSTLKADSVRVGTGPGAGFRRPHRRSQGRARAGHHDRRGPPLLHDGAATLHHRGHARPRAVHVQHGDRRFDRQPGRHPDRRASGLLPQTRRHFFVASLVGIPRLRIAVNKMDLVDFSREVFDVIVAEYLDFATRLGVADVKVLPISALHG